MRVYEDPTTRSRHEKLVASALALAILILITAFVVLYIALDPLLSDLTSTGATATETTAPTQATPDSEP